MINVTQSALPPMQEYIEYLRGIWQRNHLTNGGPLVIELENKLKEYLSAKHLFYVSNGTIALQISIKALGITKEIITTPFSFVATLSSIVWENCTPIFVDIDPQTLTIDENKIEPAISEKTQAILATHVYGNPCAVEEIEKIAQKYNIAVIYDAAHAFGVQYKGIPLTNYGDISTLSHHATKLFHTIEGGSIICKDSNIAKKINCMRNFGQNAPNEFSYTGINGKNSEFHAAMGLSLLPYVAASIKKRRDVSLCYDECLSQESNMTRPVLRKGVEYNYSYYPILFSSETNLLKAVKTLNQFNINPRRYFYPALSTLEYIKKINMPVAEDVARRVLCLPLYEDLPKVAAKDIVRLISKSIANYI